MYWQIAIDGPAGAGKSTIAKEVAKKLKFNYLDTGAMYRATTLKALDLKINMEDEAEYQFLETTSIDFDNDKLLLDGKDVTQKVRSLDVTNNVSLVSKFSYVRKKLVDLQQQLAESKNIIMDGRDIGTTVLPKANLKIFLNASVAQRATRRMQERLKINNNSTSLEETIKEIEERDKKDSTREISPLLKAEDAIEIDTSNLSVDEVVAKIISLVMERGYKMDNVKTENEKNVETNVVEETTEKEKVEDQIIEEVKSEVEGESKTTEAEAKSEEAEAKPEEAEAKSEEADTEASEETTDDDHVEESDEETQEDKTVNEAEVSEDDTEVKPVREMQLVEGTITEIYQAKKQIIDKEGKVVKKAKEQRLLVKLDNDQEGFLFRKDVANITEEEDLADIFMEGDRIKVIVKRVYPDGGKVLLSSILVEKRERIKKFEDVIKNHEFFSAKVVKSIKVGLILQYEDFSCLLPNSQIKVESENYQELIGTEIIVAPIRVDYNRIRLIVSHTVAAAIKNRQEKQEFLKTVEVGQVFEGVVKNIESYGAFVEIAKGVEGLLHISEIEHNRIVKVEKVINVGDTVKVEVIKVDKDHIGLSRKALLPNHWKDFIDSHNVDDLVSGKVIEINRAGVVLDLNEYVQGFLPKSEFSWERDTFIEDYIQMGDTLEVKIIELDLNKKRIILSRKQLTENPWNSLKLRSGDKVNATIIKVMTEGVKISVDGASGFLPKGNFGRVTEFVPGTTIEARIRMFDPAKTKLIITLREDVTIDKQSVNRYLKSQEKVTSTFGDFLDSDDFK